MLRIARAPRIIGRPDVLFLDEPTTGFDPQARRHFWVLIEALKEQGVTILLTTHYLDEAEQLADRVAVIAAGRILETDTPENLGGRQSGKIGLVLVAYVAQAILLGIIGTIFLICRFRPILRNG